MKIESRDKFYVYSRQDNYRARSAYKLLEIANFYKLFENLDRVVDLCAAPGSWSQVLRKYTEAVIVAVDMADMIPINGVICLKNDITSDKCLEAIYNAFYNSNNDCNKLMDFKCNVDLIVCDGAPNVTGFNDFDEVLQLDLLKSTLNICVKVGKEESNLLIKAFYGIYSGYIIKHFKKFYGKVDLIKPQSSKSTSNECFLLCRGMKITDCDPFYIDLKDVEKEYKIVFLFENENVFDVEYK